MAFSNYEHCPVCIAGQAKHGWKDPSTGEEGIASWPGYKMLYLGDMDTPNGMVVLCEKHSLALKPHIVALIEQAIK